MKLRNRIVIAVSFFFCALNCIIAWGISLTSVSNYDKSVGVLGIIMIVMIPISLIDPREQMQNSLAALSSIFLHFLFNLLVTVLFSLWWLVFVFVPETVLLIVLFYLVRRHK